MAIDLKKMREKLENKKGKNGFIKLQKGETVLRIVPCEDQDPFKEYAQHYNIGNNGAFLCPRKCFNETCPICEFSFQLWREGTEESKAMAKTLFAQERFYSPVLVRGEEDKGIRWWSYGKTVRDFLISLVLNEEYGDITDPDTGIDLLVTVSQKEGKRFPDTAVQPRRNSSKLLDDPEQVKKLLAEMPKIDSLMVRKTKEEIQQLLNEHWLPADTGQEVAKPDVEKYGKGETKEEKKEEPKTENEIDKAFEELLA